MECPYCAEAVKDEAIVCKHCCSDLSAARPTILAIHDVTVELDMMQGELDRLNNDIAFYQRPARYIGVLATSYVLLPAILLIGIHTLIIIVLDAHLIYLRLASILAPLLFGMAAYVLKKIEWQGALRLGAGCAALTVCGMLTVVASVDGGSIWPENLRELRETVEYGSSILFSFVTGNILASFLLRILPSTIAAADRPNVLALRAARLLGRHVTDATLRRRARRIQDIARKAGAVASLVVTASASLYTGLKGLIGS